MYSNNKNSNAMTDNEKNPETAQVIPLQENNAPETFYAGADRGDVLLQMTKALEQGVSLLVLTGEEGSGKTTICRLLERESSRFYFTVFLTKSVQSFEDVVKKTAMWLGLSSDGGYQGKNADRMMDNITAHLKREETGLLIIFDEAENIYLATLERIRKMLDRVTEAGARMHIVFSGRDTFLEKCAQLAVCDFKNSDQLQFDLAPLTEQQTGEYLHAYAMDGEDPERKGVFNDIIIRNIFSLAKGNFRKTNLLAEESLRTHGDDTSFMVLLENVKEEVEVKQRRNRQVRPHFTKRNVGYLPWLGGIGCVLLLLFFFMRPVGGDRSEEKAAARPDTVEKIEVAGAAAQAVPEEPGPGTEETAVPPVAATTSQAAQVQPAELAKEDDAAEKFPPESLDDGPVETESLGEAIEAGPQSGEQAVAAVVGETQEIPPASVRGIEPPAEKVVQIRQAKPMKIKKATASVSGGKETSNSQSTAVKVTNAAQKQPSVDQLLQKRLAAGSAWSKKGKEDLYTMQLMALTDKNAEENLKKMLDQPQYRRESENLYIFKKPANSSVVFVFYGEYANLTLARKAQENLPTFLRAHQPYPISIKGAMAKVKK